MNIVEKLRLMQTDHIPELGEAISEIEHLRREVATYKRKLIITRMHQKYSRLRADRERQLLLSGEHLL